LIFKDFKPKTSFEPPKREHEIAQQTECNTKSQIGTLTNFSLSIPPNQNNITMADIIWAWIQGCPIFKTFWNFQGPDVLKYVQQVKKCNRNFFLNETPTLFCKVPKFQF